MMPKAPTWPSTGPMTVATGAKGRRTRTDRETDDPAAQASTPSAPAPSWPPLPAGKDDGQGTRWRAPGTMRHGARNDSASVSGDRPPRTNARPGGVKWPPRPVMTVGPEKEGNEEHDAGGLGQPIALVHPRRLLFVRMRAASRAGAGGCVCRGVYACPLVYRAPRRVSLPRGEWCDTPVFLHVVYFVLWLQ